MFGNMGLEVRREEIYKDQSSCTEAKCACLERRDEKRGQDRTRGKANTENVQGWSESWEENQRAVLQSHWWREFQSGRIKLWKGPVFKKDEQDKNGTEVIYYLPRAAVTKRHTPGGWRQQKLVSHSSEAKSPRSGCQQGHTSEGPGKNPSLLLPASGGAFCPRCFSPACRLIRPLSAAIATWPSPCVSPSLIRTNSYTGLEASIMSSS